MMSFELARLYAGIVSGVALGWLIASPPESFASIPWLNVLSAVGTVGAAVGAIWIATNQRRDELKDHRLSGALQIMKRRHWMFGLIQEIEGLVEYSWPTSAEYKKCRVDLTTAQGEVQRISELMENEKWSVNDPFGDRLVQRQREKNTARKQVASAESALDELVARSSKGRANIEAVAKKMDILDSIHPNADPVFLKLAYTARSDLDMAAELTSSYQMASNMKGNLKRASELIWSAFERINAAEALVKLECDDFLRRERSNS